jgi:hypothetical protein
MPPAPLLVERESGSRVLRSDSQVTRDGGRRAPPRMSLLRFSLLMNVVLIVTLLVVTNKQVSSTVLHQHDGAGHPWSRSVAHKA